MQRPMHRDDGITEMVMEDADDESVRPWVVGQDVAKHLDRVMSSIAQASCKSLEASVAASLGSFTSTNWNELACVSEGLVANMRRAMFERCAASANPLAAATFATVGMSLLIAMNLIAACSFNQAMYWVTLNP